jgi:hypothetical protein
MQIKLKIPEMKNMRMSIAKIIGSGQQEEAKYFQESVKDYNSYL